MHLTLKNAHEEDLSQFLQDVHTLDQSDPRRSNAQKCYQMLKAREAEFIGSSLEQVYWHQLSLELFHMAQEQARDSRRARYT